MGVPRLEPAEIPFIAEQRALTYSIEVANRTLEISAVSMGNPHAVILVDNVDTAPVREIGRPLECHPRFPEKVNVGFLQIIDRNNARLRVFERGTGETLACGTGTCAAVVAGIQQGLLDERVRVQLRGGELDIRWQGEGHPVWMAGPTARVFDGVLRMYEW
jgi:diaminopimelate epimerase